MVPPWRNTPVSFRNGGSCRRKEIDHVDSEDFVNRSIFQWYLLEAALDQFQPSISIGGSDFELGPDETSSATDLPQ